MSMHADTFQEAAFHQARSCCLDSFVAIEEAIFQLVHTTGAKSASTFITCRIEALRKPQPSPRLSKARLQELFATLDAAIALNAVRNDIAHGRLRVARIDRETYACFFDFQQAGIHSQVARLFSLDQLDRLASDAHGLTTRLAAWKPINPASSPPPPSPDAAGGP